MKNKIIIVAIAGILTTGIFIFLNSRRENNEPDLEFETVIVDSDSMYNTKNTLLFDFEKATFLPNTSNRLDSFRIELNSLPAYRYSQIEEAMAVSDDRFTAQRYWSYAIDQNMNIQLAMGKLDTVNNRGLIYSGILFSDDNFDVVPARPNLFTRLITSKSQQEKAWRKLLKDCMKTEQDKRQSYFGVSSFSIGTLISKRTLKPTAILKDILLSNPAEYDKLITPQPKGSCSQTITTGTEFSSAFAAVSSLADAELTAEIIRAKKTSVVPGRYHNTFLLVPALKKLLKNTTNKDLLEYKELLYSGENYIILSTKTIGGYEADIELNSTTSPELKLKLDEGIVYKIDSAGIELKYKKVSENKIRASSSELFVPFGEYGKLKEKKTGGN